MVVRVFGPPTAIVATISGGMAKVLLCNAGEGAQKVGTILQFSYQALYFHSGYMQEIFRFEKTPCPNKHCLVEKNPQKVRCYDHCPNIRHDIKPKC